MNKYELSVILSASIDDEAKEALIAKITGFIESAKGKVVSCEKIGVKKFAYSINYKNEGYYVLFNIEVEGSAVASIEKQMNLIETITRFMFIKK